jgi:hypothetical protein
MTVQSRAWGALSERLFETLPPIAAQSLVGGTHVRRFDDNLLPGFSLDQVAGLRAQLAGGAGGELRPTKTGKRPAHAPYSSAALAINAFGRWLGSEEFLSISGLTGFDAPLTIERKLRIRHGGGVANLDCYLEGRDIVVGVESKLTEHLVAHRPVEWKAPYRAAEMATLLSGGWTRVLEDSLAARWRPSHVGLEQLIKHALALNSHADDRPRHLVYCFWEPTNGAEIDEVVEHRREVAELQARVGDAPPQLHAVTFADLLAEWARLVAPDWTSAHVRQLRDRYSVSV